MDTVNKEWNIKVVFITFYKFSVTVKQLTQQPKPNYQIILDKTLEQLTMEGKRPSLMLHSCCAPCSSYVLEYLNKYFDITVFYYNPNISPEKEYIHRVEEIKRLINEMCPQ